MIGRITLRLDIVRYAFRLGDVRCLRRVIVLGEIRLVPHQTERDFIPVTVNDAGIRSSGCADVGGEVDITPRCIAHCAIIDPFRRGG